MRKRTFYRQSSWSPSTLVQVTAEVVEDDVRLECFKDQSYIGVYDIYYATAPIGYIKEEDGRFVPYVPEGMPAPQHHFKVNSLEAAATELRDDYMKTHRILVMEYGCVKHLTKGRDYE